MNNPIKVLEQEKQELNVQIKLLNCKYKTLDPGSVAALAVSTAVTALQIRYTQIQELLIENRTRQLLIW